MATNDVNLQVINSMTQEQMQSLKDSDGKIPSLANQLIMTDEEDVNLSQLRTKVLWENPNPTVSFNTSTTISLGSENYGYLLIEYMAYPTIYASMIVPFKEGEGSIYYSLSDTSTSNSTYFVQLGQRKFTINSSNQIKFGDGYWVNHSEKLLLNNYMIPTKITGILKQPAMVYTGAELHEGNGISIENGVISASNIKVLWENPNPSSAFSPQTVTLNSNDYDFLMISMSMRTVGSTGNFWQTWIMRKNEDGCMFSDYPSTQQAYNGQGIARQFEGRSETAIYFDNCYLRENNNVLAYLANQFNIPQTIYGIKVV